MVVEVEDNDERVFLIFSLLIPPGPRVVVPTAAVARVGCVAYIISRAASHLVIGVRPTNRIESCAAPRVCAVVLF